AALVAEERRAVDLAIGADLRAIDENAVARSREPFDPVEMAVGVDVEAHRPADLAVGLVDGRGLAGDLDHSGPVEIKGDGRDALDLRLVADRHDLVLAGGDHLAMARTLDMR